jgi:hypothetical protein
VGRKKAQDGRKGVRVKRRWGLEDGRKRVIVRGDKVGEAGLIGRRATKKGR